ncbi:Uncharacterised protein [Legionella hackeliae]|nr:Uncharacterised protein [Legionella hackeliae]
MLETVLNPMPTCLGLSEAGRSERDRVEFYAYLPWLVRADRSVRGRVESYAYLPWLVRGR